MATRKTAKSITEDVIQKKIYRIRHQNVMLDKDLAELYEVKPIRLREQVKRNLNRFPESFMFQLTREETLSLKKTHPALSWKHLGGTLPFAFSEYGVLMLANVLRSDQAVQLSIRLIEFL